MLRIIIKHEKIKNMKKKKRKYDRLVAFRLSDNVITELEDILEYNPKYHHLSKSSFYRMVILKEVMKIQSENNNK